MKNIIPGRFSSAIMLMVMALTFHSDQAIAQNISNDDLIGLARAVARGEASEKQQAIVFASNQRLNNLAYAGKITNSEYQANQRAFVALNDSLISKAATKNGLSVAPTPQAEKIYKAGTDTDRQLQNPKGTLTVEHVKNVRNGYNQEVENYLKSMGVGSAAGENWAKKLNTDIMPSPNELGAAEFKAASKFINSQGGLAYENADAAKLQLAIDNEPPKNISLHEAEAYHNEMQKKIQLMNNETQRLNRDRAKISDPTELENLDIEIRKHNAFMSKYIARDNDAAELINKQTTEQNPDLKSNTMNENEWSKTSSERIKNAQKRDSSKNAISGEAYVGAVNKHLAEKATQRFNNAIAGAAVAGGKTGEGAEIIAGNLKNLSLTQQGQAISDLEIKYGKDMAKAISSELKKSLKTTVNVGSKTSAPNVSRKATICKGLGLVSTALNVKNQYSEGKTTTEILWNMSIGGTLETVNKETADYTTREIERLKNEYRNAGEDPDSMSTRLKIMAEATVKGTFYGSAIGSYDLLKSASKGVAGAALTAGESAIFLVGETLDTQNVLEQSYAEIKAQNMEQSVQNARAAKFGREAISELKRLAADATRLRSILEQNAKSARLFCRQSDQQLDELKAFLRETVDPKNSETAANLPDDEKRLTKSLAANGSEMLKLNQQAEEAIKALAAGGDSIAAGRTASGLNTAADRQAAALESARIEIEKIGELGATTAEASEILADFENRRSLILERGRQAVANAIIMRNNEAQFKKILACFDSLKEKVEKAEGFFVDKRQANEGDWMVIKSRMREIARPDGSMPEAFFGEVGTLERLTENLQNEVARLKVPGGIQPVETDITDTIAVFERLSKPLNANLQFLSELRATIKNLQDNAMRVVSTVPAGLKISCQSNVSIGESVNMKVTLPDGLTTGSPTNAASGNQSAKFDPYGGHDPESIEGMQALLNYKRAYDSGQAKEYIAANQTGSSNTSKPGFLFQWNYGDGTQSGKVADKSVNHSFPRSGQYDISVRAYAADTPDSVIAAGRIQITVIENSPQPEPNKLPDKSTSLLPCGHRPGECPSPKPIKCTLHSGEISVRNH